MSETSCGCGTTPCGCCEGVQVLTPASTYNRPGLDALSYRVGTHGRFFETMKARLSTMTVSGVAGDGQAAATFRPLQGLSTRDNSDFSIALLDGWASVGDVLSFYQERIANEGYLRTATERRSVLELSRLVGYTLRPGVAATAYLAYTLDDNQVEPVTIAAGARSQSVPGPGEQPQYFETGEDLVAHREWNNLQVRLHQPQNLTLANALTVESILVAGSSTGLKPGDKLLLLYADDGSSVVVRGVAGVDAQFVDQTSAIRLQPLEPTLRDCAVALYTFQLAAEQAALTDGSSQPRQAIKAAQALLQSVYVETPIDPKTWLSRLRREISGNDNLTNQRLSDAFATLETRLGQIFGGGNQTIVTTDPATFVTPLLKPAVAQARNSLQLRRNLAEAFLASEGIAVFTAASPSMATAATARGGDVATTTRLLARSSDIGGSTATNSASDVSDQPQTPHLYAEAATQLLVNFAPRLQDSYYQAWAGATLNPTPAPLKTLYALRSRNTLFGATAAKLPVYSKGGDNAPPAGTLLSQDQWNDWGYANDESTKNAFLDQANDAIIAGSYVLIRGYGAERVLRVTGVTTAPRTAYGLSSQSTQLEFSDDWRGLGSDITDLRTVQVYAQSEALTLVDVPLAEDVGGTDQDGNAVMTIELDGLYQELTSGRWIILAGERRDIPQVDQVSAAELLMVSGVSHSFDPNLPGDTVHTTLTLATPTAYQYKRDTVTIYGNVVKATQGVTCNEALGSGDGSQSLQSFTLKQPPLTFVAAPTAAGAASTLQVYVDSVAWQQTDSLAWLGPKDRGFTTLTDDAGNTTVVFGDGEHGARLPTGMQNINAVYRSGLGSGGNVKAQQISLLQTRPLGVKAVINPLRASGGADPEGRDLARENAPLSVMPLDRLVSLQDYASFTRRFAGIAKAVAQRTTDGRRELLYLTIAGVEDAPIDPSSDLYQNLLTALVQLGDPDLPIRVDVRELKALTLSANIRLLPGYQWEAVATALRSMLLDRFGFDRRALGQPALRCELLSAMQGVAGVSYIDIDAFGAIPERTTVKTDKDGVTQVSRNLLTQDQIAERVAVITGLRRYRLQNEQLQTLRLQSSGQRLDGVDAFAGGYDGMLVRPAELAIFTPSVPDTLILNQIP